MLNHVYVDKKWFYLTQIKGRVINISEEEEIRKTSLKRKRFVTKVIFITAVAHPRYDRTRKAEFHGKIGIWPIVATNPARHSSINRPKGAPVTTPLTVDKAIYKKLLIEKVFPAIRDLFPSGTGRSIYVQQDNAKPHSCWNDPIIQQEARRGGWKIKLQNQPPNSPDLNVLDLGFFRSIQSLQEKKSTRNLNDLIAAVSKAFDDVSSQTLLKNFVT